MKGHLRNIPAKDNLGMGIKGDSSAQAMPKKTQLKIGGDKGNELALPEHISAQVGIIKICLHALDVHAWDN